MVAVTMGAEGEGIMRQLLEANADVNFETKAISLSTFLIFSTKLQIVDFCSMMWRFLRLLTKPGVFKRERSQKRVGFAPEQRLRNHLVTWKSWEAQDVTLCAKREVEPFTVAACRSMGTRQL